MLVTVSWFCYVAQEMSTELSWHGDVSTANLLVAPQLWQVMWLMLNLRFFFTFFFAFSFLFLVFFHTSWVSFVSVSCVQLDSATSLIHAAKNLMNAVVLTVKACYVASTKVSACLVGGIITKLASLTVKACFACLSQKLVWVWLDVCVSVV